MLTPAQQATLHALVDRIIPPDEDPGAWDAGVGDYLAGQFERDLRADEDTYRLGLDALEAEAQARSRRSFTALLPAEQDALLRQVEAGQVAAPWPTDPAGFFETVVQHVAEGYYSDPGNGGNRGAAAWRMIGFLPGAPVAEQP